MENEYRDRFKSKVREAGSNHKAVIGICGEWGIETIETEWLSPEVWRLSGVWVSEGLNIKILGGIAETQFLLIPIEDVPIY
jgi:hypothetical protein